VPSVIIPVVAVTKGNVKDTVIKDGYWKASDICTAAYAKYCKEAGIS
jgi:D-xylose transport system substrate-binding protein